MARPKKQTIEYFPHYCNHHKTIFVLESKYGNDGYAFWFKILEILGSTHGMFYDCNNVADWEFLLAKTHLNSETANNILDTLADLQAIDYDLWKEKKVWSQNLVDGVRDAFKRRITEMPVKPSLCIQKPSLNDDSVNGNGESKVKESKVKESKEKESKEETCSDGFQNKDIYKFYEQCGFGFLNQTLTDMIDADIQVYTKEWVVAAMNEAVRQNKYKYSYVEGVLRNWKADGRDGKRGADSKGIEDPSREGIGFELGTD
jgi:DnaD/phage-associated family protein